MTVLRELYYCEICHNLVEIVQEGQTALVCCGQDMSKLVAKTEDQGLEKHVPVVEKSDNGVLVKVGSVEHPMEEKHHIKFIEVLTKNMVYRAELKPGDKPQAFFPVKFDDITEVREFCNIHSLWKK
ncbi:MAG: desulfoferrodoxin [Candidatus Cloacimonetes bacterium]|nr:desulfoferrodoxin [Candidatus Cloacimonadota bacterium]